MKDEVIELVTKGDYHLKESKSKFWMDKEDEQGEASVNCSKAIKKYLRAYELFLLPGHKINRHYHVLLQRILDRDPEFQKFFDKISKVKGFAKESRSKGENFYILDDDIDKSIKIAIDVRDYIARKIQFEKQFLAEYIGTSFMAI